MLRVHSRSLARLFLSFQVQCFSFLHFPFFVFWLQCTYRQLLGTDGRPRGFGFVVFANNADADRAIKEMNGVELLGRPLRINAAMGRPGGRGLGGRGDGGHGRGDWGRGGR